MPIIEYMLLALLGSAGAATPGGTPGGPFTRTFTADSVTQPSGGTEGLLGEADTGRKGRRHLKATREHWKNHRRSKVTGAESKVSSSGGAGGSRPNTNAQPRPPRPRGASNSNKNSK
jgi:hypothetical protein